MAQWRVLQEKIDPELAEKPEKQIEAERQGAQFIRDKSATLEADPEKQVQEIHSVAVPLSDSLGVPKSVIEVDDSQKAIKALERGLLAEQARAEEWKAFAKKYAYKELEDTGVNLFTPTALLGFAGIAALCIFVPGFLTFLLFVIRRMRTGLQQVTQAVEQYKIEKPKEAKVLGEHLSSAMDATTKKLIKGHRAKVDYSNLMEIKGGG